MRNAKLTTGLAMALLVSTLGLQGCVATLLNLPTPEEKKALLESHIQPSSRIAVVTMQLGTYRLPRNGFGPPLGDAAARVVEDVLGVESLVLDQSANGEWAKELDRIAREGGGLSGESHADYFRSRGFDAWLVVSTTGTGGISAGKGGNASWVYNPGTRLYTVNGTMPRKLLYWSAKRHTARCEIQGRLIFNYKKKFEILFPEDCANRVMNGLQNELTATLAL